MKFLKPKYAIVIIFLVALFIDFSEKKWEKEERVIAHDIHFYYSYLPAIFIYDDVKLEKSNYRYTDDQYFFWNQPDQNGNKVGKMTSGLAILYAPFFMVAHFIAINTSYAQDGFSDPYKMLLLLSALFYLVLGMDFLVKSLRWLNFKEHVIFITILLIGTGTNLLSYSSLAAPMPHVYGFALFAGFIYNTIKWYESKSLKRIIYLGLIFGLITLIRPSNGLVVLFFVLFRVSSLKDLKLRLLLFVEKLPQLLLVIPLVLLVWSPQFLYWKVVSGEFLYYSYREEGFYFLAPRIFQGLFSFRKGWLIYTPIMAFAIAGFFFLKERAKELRFSIIVFGVLNIYVIFSWWCWWYGGTFGQRTLIESYALLAIPFSAFVVWVLEQKLFVKTLFALVSLFFIWLNIFQTYQFENKSLHHDGMSKELYFKQFGKMEKIDDFEKYIARISYEKNKIRNKKNKEEIKVKPQEVKKVNIIAPNGKFLFTDWDGVVKANKEDASTWEEFYISEEDEKNRLMSHEQLYFSIKKRLITQKEEVLGEGAIEVIFLNDNSVVFKVLSGDYLGVNQETHELEPLSKEITDQSKFKIKNLN